MAKFSKEFLSGGSADGRGIKVAATATPGTLIHTAHVTAKDEIYLDVFNSDAVARLLTIEFGGVTDPDDIMELSIPPQAGRIWVIEGLILSGSKVVRAFAATANVLTINGFVNRITG